MSHSKISVFFSIAVATSCGSPSDDSEKKAAKPDIIAEHDQSVAAVDCRSKNQFWNAATAACEADVVPADYPCTVAELDKHVAPIVQAPLPDTGKRYSDTKAEGFQPLRCGIQFTGSPRVLHVVWTKPSGTTVLFRSETYLEVSVAAGTGSGSESQIGSEVGPGPDVGSEAEPGSGSDTGSASDVVATAPDFAALFIGTWETCRLGDDENARKFTIVFASNTFKQTTVVYSDVSACDETKKSTVLELSGTWQGIAEGVGTFADPYALGFALTKSEKAFFDAAGLAAANSFATCGFNDWMLGVSKDITDSTHQFCSDRIEASDKETKYSSFAVVDGKFRVDGDFIGGTSYSGTFGRGDISSAIAFDRVSP